MEHARFTSPPRKAPRAHIPHGESLDMVQLDDEEIEILGELYSCRADIGFYGAGEDIYGVVEQIHLTQSGQTVLINGTKQVDVMNELKDAEWSGDMERVLALLIAREVAVVIEARTGRRALEWVAGDGQLGR